MKNQHLKAVLAGTVILLLVLVIVLRLCIGQSKVFFVIAAVDWTAQIAIFLWIIIKYILERKKSKRILELAKEGEKLRLEYSFLHRVAGLPKKFSYKELEIATNGFSILLGRGASASVFKGLLVDGTQVAVKRINRSDQGLREFQAEVAAIANVHHVNLVRLMGFCAEGPHRTLVYEYVQNGSLDTWIFDAPVRSVRHQVLPWNVRFGIALDIARALSYLHHDCRSRILHLDVKPENILLDESFGAKVSDFGLSSLMNRDESRVLTTLRGTRGYVAPEWLLDHGITEKSDVYSFGMVVFEMIGGRRNVRQNYMEDVMGSSNTIQEAPWSYFPSVVMKAAREEKLMEIVDRRLNKDSVNEAQLRLLINVALWCIQEKSRLRPSMRKVVDMLEGRIVLEDPPETKMIIVDLLNLEQLSPRHSQTRSSPRAAEEGGGNDTQILVRSLSYSFAMSNVSAR
eukprot:Gb_38152 [translate_table: standard]